MKFAVLQLTGCAGCEVSLFNAGEQLDFAALSYMPLLVSVDEIPEVDLLLVTGGIRNDDWELTLHVAARAMEWDFKEPCYYMAAVDIEDPTRSVGMIRMQSEDGNGKMAGDELTTGFSMQDGTGYGLVEAPRGPLIHHYVIEDGLIRKARFIIPTVHNNFSIERALTSVARQYVKEGMVEMELEEALGWVVRAFDPCIPCATH